ncbi:hypothetical protein [Streptomyces sp. SAJ15]|uniref:hypothetical protein n=1 Tax=Streptomyces sp. SAJ15 TaxID=2011095 RepID=UPI0011864324|nr:hypothetical protein [Streptomyces sp. SAJ15]TVL87786.1 hypothetical protein CD790_32915 [Streptomyces sp. SAJ15]
MAQTYDFPDALRDAQLQLHQVRAELSALLSSLPWSVEPHDGWSDPADRWGRSERPASPGWTDEEKQAVAALRGREKELTVAVVCDPLWNKLTGSDLVEARMAIKHAHEQPTDEAAEA